MFDCLPRLFSSFKPKLVTQPLAQEESHKQQDDMKLIPEPKLKCMKSKQSPPESMGDAHAREPVFATLMYDSPVEEDLHKDCIRATATTTSHQCPRHGKEAKVKSSRKKSCRQNDVACDGDQETSKSAFSTEFARHEWTL